eukprot:TRINITY_DN23628_c0_g1_i1.p1 TRINITY_DN23628_c0_g1~~TRINITY_DN23628_c0_g1_i1.p1  ORF type:complete len:826 (+),score=139.90 TRINITY_DN23628_c0_g1_i1:72-2549(+)
MATVRRVAVAALGVTAALVLVASLTHFYSRSVEQPLELDDVAPSRRLLHESEHEFFGTSAGLLRIKSKSALCMGSPGQRSLHAAPSTVLMAQYCDEDTLSQRWSLDEDGRLLQLSSGLCVGIADSRGMLSLFSGMASVALQECDGNRDYQRWNLSESGNLQNLYTKQCISLSRSSVSARPKLKMVDCSGSESKLSKLSKKKAKSKGKEPGPRDDDSNTEVGGVEEKHWEWTPLHADKKRTGYLQYIMTGKCLDSRMGQARIADCQFHRPTLGQLWFMTDEGILKNHVTGECLNVPDTTSVATEKHEWDPLSGIKLFWTKGKEAIPGTKNPFSKAPGSKMVTIPCFANAGDNDIWAWHDGIIRNRLTQRCIYVDGAPALCSGHDVVAGACEVDARKNTEVDRRWRFIPLADVPERPRSASFRRLPDEVVNLISGVKARLVKPGVECASTGKDLGKKNTLEECMLAAHRDQGKFFIYGVRGTRRGKCFREGTKSISCPEGFKAAEYNFYVVEPVPVSEKMPMEMQMGELASTTYSALEIGSEVAGWTVVKQCDKKMHKQSHDFMTIFKKGDQCTLAFAGTDDLLDAMQDMNGVTLAPACGEQFHKGFLEEVKGFVRARCWKQEFAPYLASKECSGGRNAVGHSLGGAIAGVLAFCANANFHQHGLRKSGAGTGLHAMQPDAPPFTITGLYTFGAPGVSIKPLSNGLARDGCFQGARFFNLDATAIDPVPWMSSVRRLVHPNMEAHLLHENADGYVGNVMYPCKSEESKLLPLTDKLCRPSVADHLMYRYLYRLEKVFANRATKREKEAIIAADDRRLAVANKSQLLQ